jgi:hypothetical protein
MRNGVTFRVRGSAMISITTKLGTTKCGWMAHARRMALCGALGLLVLATVAPMAARAQDDDDDGPEKTTIWNFEKKFLNGVMRGLGLKNGNESSIDYRERSPLVIPPSRNLPPPEQVGAGRTAAWPDDPDLKRKREVAAKRKAQNYRGYDPEQEGRNLTPSELNPTGSTRTSGTTRTGTPDSMGDDGRPKRPSELGYFGGLWSSFGKSQQKDEVATFEREPTRDSLTAPPVGYQTPSAAQRYGLGNRKEQLKTTPYDPAVGN